MTPLERYNACLLESDFNADNTQKSAVNMTQSLYDELVYKSQKSEGFINRVKQRINQNRNKEPIKGLYFWGGVGRGKTMIIDMFFDSLPFAEKKRIHFHRFMQMVHYELKQIDDKENPLQVVAEKLVAEIRIICLDEFHVTDITDAMLLGGLLKALFARGVTLVTTSNEAPDELYHGGLQRDRFLPAIELIKLHTKVFNLDSGQDYRLQFLDKAEIYHFPIDQAAGVMLENNFQHIAPDDGKENSILEIEGREIRSVRCADGVVWFEFKQLCDGPRGAADYIELARQYQTVLISDIPVMSESDNDLAKRFITLIDEFYDRQVKLIVTAAAPPDGLYVGSKLTKLFNRTLSRLQEMQTHDYLAKPHLS